MCIMDSRIIEVKQSHRPSPNVHRPNAACDYCLVALYEWIALWLGNASLIWTENCSNKGEINRGVEASGMKSFSPFVIERSCDLRTESKTHYLDSRPVPALQDSDSRPVPTVEYTVPLSARLHELHTERTVFHNTASVPLGSCCSHCRPNPLTFFSHVGSADSSGCAGDQYLQNNRSVECPVLIVIDLPGMSHFFIFCPSIFIISLNSFLLQRD